MYVYILGWRLRYGAEPTGNEKPSFVYCLTFVEFMKVVASHLSAPGALRYDYRIVTIEVAEGFDDETLRAQIEATVELWLPPGLDSTLIPHVHEPDWLRAHVLGDADEVPCNDGILEVKCKHCDLRGNTTVPAEVVSW